MPEYRPGRTSGLLRGVSAALVTLMLASCSSTSDPVTRLGLVPQASVPAPIATSDSTPPAETTASEPAFASLEGDPGLPEVVASVPQANPTASVMHVLQPPPAAAPVMEAERTAAAAFPEAPPAPLEDGAFEDRIGASAPAPSPAPREAVVTALVPPPPPPPVIATATPVAAPVQKPRGFLSSLFSPTDAQPRARVVEPARKPVTQLASANPTPPARLDGRATGEEGRSRPLPREAGGALPGVRGNALFEIRRSSGTDDDSDIDIDEDDGSVQVASASGMARLAPNGLMIQHGGVDTACLKPSLVRVLKSIERHYGKKVVVTSGYRSSDRNRRARGARNSLHMYCAAADVQVAGVTKWQLAEHVRSMPGRGGVGTYCHTESVHVDVGPERDWNWRCRRRK